jgi:hypothetical protein
VCVCVHSAMGAGASNILSLTEPFLAFAAGASGTHPACLPGHLPGRGPPSPRA